MANVIILFSILVSGALTMLILNWIVDFGLRKRISENENPLALYLFKAVTFISAAYILSELINTFKTISQILPSSYTGRELILKEISYYCIFFGILILLILLIVWFSTMLFRVFTKGENIFIEVANNNLKSIFLFSGILLALAITLKTGVTPLLDEFIPYPTMPIFR